MKRGDRKGRLKKPQPYFDRKRGRWIARVFIGNGRKRTRDCKTRAEAKAAIDELWAERSKDANGRPNGEPVERLTFGALLDQWLAAGDWKPATRDDYAAGVAKLQPLAVVPLRRLRPVDLQLLIDDQKSTAMKKRVRKIAKTALQWGCRLQLCEANPAAETLPVKHRAAAVDVFTAAEVQSILEAMPERWAVAAELMFVLAVRPGELWGLRWSDWRPDDGSLKIQRNVKEVRGKLIVQEAPKTDAGNRSLPLPSRAVELLQWRRMEAMKAGQAAKQFPVFASRDAGHLRQGNFRHKIWRQALKSAGIEYRVPYTLRHTAATMMLNSGRVSLAAVSRWLGHASVETTLRHYSHLMAGELQSIVGFWDAADRSAVRKG